MTEQWKCGVRLDSGELCGKPYAIMTPGKGYFCAYHHFQLTGEKLGPLCCVFEPCPNPVTWVEILLTPAEEIWYDGEVPMNPAYLQGFCDYHMDEEWNAGMSTKHLGNVERVIKIHTGGVPLHLDSSR